MDNAKSLPNPFKPVIDELLRFSTVFLGRAPKELVYSIVDEIVVRMSFDGSGMSPTNHDVAFIIALTETWNHNRDRVEMTTPAPASVVIKRFVKQIKLARDLHFFCEDFQPNLAGFGPDLEIDETWRVGHGG